jgi:hypothetical protein
MSEFRNPHVCLGALLTPLDSTLLLIDLQASAVTCCTAEKWNDPHCCERSNS